MEHKSVMFNYKFKFDNLFLQTRIHQGVRHREDKIGNFIFYKDDHTSQSEEKLGSESLIEKQMEHTSKKVVFENRCNKLQVSNSVIKGI